MNYIKEIIASLTLILMSSCSMMHDDMSDCHRELRVRFSYDMNMKFADAFDSSVSSVTLYAYDSSGQLAMQKTEPAADIKARGGYMTLNNLAPADYTLIAWAEGEERHTGSYAYGTPTSESPSPEALDCRIIRDSRYIAHDLTPLYHGLVAKADLTMQGYGVKTVTVPLTKDTNVIRVVLQNASGKRLDSDSFAFYVDDDNSWLAYDNSPLADDSITYRPWSQYDGTVGNSAQPSDEGTAVSAVVAETTVNRLFASKHPRLRVVNTTSGKTVFSIPLIDYALLVKGNYNRSMSDQEYLDRQDEYNFVFFVDDNLNWLSASIIVNSWRVVLHDTDLK